MGSAAPTKPPCGALAGSAGGARGGRVPMREAADVAPALRSLNERAAQRSPDRGPLRRELTGASADELARTLPSLRSVVGAIECKRTRF